MVTSVSSEPGKAYTKMMAPSQERSRRRSTYPVVPRYSGPGGPAPDVPTPMSNHPGNGHVDIGRDRTPRGASSWAVWRCGGVDVPEPGGRGTAADIRGGGTGPPHARPRAAAERARGGRAGLRRDAPGGAGRRLVRRGARRRTAGRVPGRPAAGRRGPGGRDPAGGAAG